MRKIELLNTEEEEKAYIKVMIVAVPRIGQSTQLMANYYFNGHRVRL